MDQEFFLLNVAVVLAAALQSATGIGFGAVAGPILLIVLNDGSAIQISIALNLLIAVILSPFLWNNVDKSILRDFVVGLVIGSPLGLLVFLNIGITMLKAIAGVGVLLTLFFTLKGMRSRAREQGPSASKSIQIPVGVVAGIMGVCLAMPGPIPAAWMSARAFDKETIRATILAMFVVSYAIAMGLQLTIVGVGTDALRLGFLLAPATLLGLLAGHLVSHRITEIVFRRLLVAILASTVVILFSSLL
jgi:uncharacterized membrane protein YfcA